MTKTLYALLVGIDAYEPPVRALRGCVNDITVIDELLEQRRATAEFEYSKRVLTDAQATRDAIIAGFREHLAQAGPDDVALFYYSGHGSQEQAPPEFWPLEPDRLNETLVCFDSRREGRWDLADKELAKLVDEVAQRDAHVLMVLDCCHSGSGTRGDEEDVEVRRAPTDTRLRPLDSFLVTPAEALAAGATRSTDTPSGWSSSRGRHILLAGCRADEEAKEYRGGGRQRGIFSYFLIESLVAAADGATYRDVFERAAALVRANIGRQAPQIEASELRDLDRPFLGGAVGPRPAGYTVRSDRAHGWVIDGGAVHGIQPPDGDDATLLALFPFDADDDTMRDLSASIGHARVTGVQPDHSTVELTLVQGAPNTNTTYKGIVTAVPLPPLAVQLTGDVAGVEAARSALAGSALVREAGAGAAARLRLHAQDGRYVLSRSGDARALTAAIEGYDESAAHKAVQRLEHIARWFSVAELANPAGRLKAGDVALELHTFTGPPATRNPASAPTSRVAPGDVRLRYEQRDGGWTAPLFKIKIINRSNRTLYCTLLDLTQRFAVDPGLLRDGGSAKLEPGQEAWALDGDPLEALVPDELWQQGITEVRDIIKLIASTEQFNPLLLAQDKLDLPPPEPTRSVPRDTLSRLMQRAATREVGAYGGTDRVADWTTAQTEIVVVRPLEATPVPIGDSGGRAAELAAGVELLPHPALRARARLSSLSLAGRDLGTLATPPLLRDLEVQPWELTSARSGEPGLSVLELIEVEDHTVVTPEQPLRLRVAQPLAPDEHVLPVGFDGEFWLPLGAAERDGDTTTLRLDRLSDPLDGGERSLLGSIKIFLQKVVSEHGAVIANRLGLAYQHPLLAATYVDDAGALTAYVRPDDVRDRVAAAERIVLYVHGIIGETAGMARSARILGINEQPLPVPLGQSYDLVLTFDYENINTSIENNARLLKARLEAVGLGPHHGKTLHIVAHSMGGLVSRWFIEREGGNRMVQRLVLVGTPNAGSPWPTVQAWATTAVGLALNGLASVAWPLKALGTLVGAIETIDVSLDQMAPDSEFLKALAASDDPHVAYIVLAGNTSTAEAGAGAEGKWERLLRKLSPRSLVQGATALAFFGQPNDIAVSTTSIGSVPAQREPRPVIRELACDHMSYFTTGIGLHALADAAAD